MLDFEFVRRGAGGVRVVELSHLSAVAGFDTAFWDGASSHLLGSEDIEALGDDIRDGELALVLLIEQQWLIGLTRSWTDDGARVIAEGGVSPQDLIDALDAAELNASPADDMQQKVELLSQLGELRDSGVLTDAEFDAKKAAILG